MENNDSFNVTADALRKVALKYFDIHPSCIYLLTPRQKKSIMAVTCNLMWNHLLGEKIEKLNDHDLTECNSIESMEALIKVMDL